MDDNPWDDKSPKKKPERPKPTNNPFTSDWQAMLKKASTGGGLPPMPDISGAGRGVWILIALTPVVLWVMSGFFRVQEGDLGAVLRFGQMSRVVTPGLHYRLPAPIEEVVIKKVDVINKIDGGATSKGDEMNMILTTDENIVQVGYTVLWKIHDVVDFLFVGREPEDTIRLAAESVIREVVGQSKAQFVLTKDREQISASAQELLQKVLDAYKIGVQIVSVQLQRVEPPSQVIKAFNDMQASLTDADRLKNEAEAYKNDIIPRARGEAQKILQSARAYREKVVLQAEGETARFESILVGASGKQDVARMALFSRMIPPLLAKIPKTLLDGKAGQGVLPYFQLNQSKNPPKEGESKNQEGASS